MEKNRIWAISLYAVLMGGFFVVQSLFFSPKTEEKDLTQTTESSNNENQVENKVSTEKISESQNIEKVEEEKIKEENFVITTNKIKVTFTNRGGDIIGYELIEKDERGNLKNKDVNTGKGVELIENISDKNRAFGISLGDSTKPIINDIFTAKKLDDYSIGFFKNFSIKKSDGKEENFTLVKTYTFKPNDYTFKLNVTIDGDENFEGLNVGGVAYTLRTAPQIGPKYNPKTNKYEYRELVSFNGEKAKKIRLGNKQTKNYEKEWVWTALAGKYFETIVYPENKDSMESTVVYNSEVEVGDSINGQVKLTRKSIDTKEVSDTYYIYCGPRNEKEFKVYTAEDKNEWGLTGLHFDDSLQGSGFWYWLEVILKFLLENTNKLVKNWGVSIIIVTIILKVALFPITKKSLEGTQKMQKFQPKMQELQAKYKGDPQRLQMETAKMYKEIGYNPMSGCLPMIFQFMILFAMYNLFNNYFEFRGASFIPGWIDDLSVGDHIGPTFEKSLPILEWNQIRILPVIYVISQLLFGKITQNGGTATAGQNSNQMKMMMYGMPIMFFFFLYNAPSGLFLYWTVSNIFQLGQQLVINKMMKNKR